MNLRHAVIPVDCRTDVSSRNLVILLRKERREFKWETLEALPNVVEQVELSDATPPSSTVASCDTDTAPELPRVPRESAPDTTTTMSDSTSVTVDDDVHSAISPELPAATHPTIASSTAPTISQTTEDVSLSAPTSNVASKAESLPSFPDHVNPDTLWGPAGRPTAVAIKGFTLESPVLYELD